MDVYLNDIEKFLEIIMDHIDEGVHVVDGNGLTVVYNKKMAELENMDRNMVLNKDLLEVFPSLTKENSTLLQCLKTGEVIKNKQQEYLNKLGQKITTINTTIPLFFNNQKFALEIAQDITEVKDLYNKIIRLQERLIAGEEKSGLGNKYFTFPDIIGEDRGLKKVIMYARQAAKTDSSILLVGDTGTGKELFAQSIHSASIRGDKPFIAQNCAALPDNLLEGILFGTRKGGFTGAVNRKGLFEQANRGTLLLDEINSMSTALQAKLLRVLQEGAMRPVGGNKDISIDVRIIATLNTPPVKAIKEGTLREDLYYRLAVVLLYLPLLSERGDDIILLSNYFIETFNKKFGCQVRGLSKEVKEIFKKYSWPGNVRQLEHVIEGAMNIIGEDEFIQEEHVGPFLLEDRELTKLTGNELYSPGLQISDKVSLPERLDRIEKEIIKNVLQETGGNVTRAARKLGIRRQSLQYRLDKYNIRDKK